MIMDKPGRSSSNEVVMNMNVGMDGEPVSKRAKLTGSEENSLSTNFDHGTKGNELNVGAQDTSRSSHKESTVEEADFSTVSQNQSEKIQPATKLENLETLKDDNEKTEGKSHQSYQDENNSDEKLTPLNEIQAGIIEYLGDHRGFSAIIKQRYSDFIVNEIDTDGKVVHLKDLSPPKDVDDESYEAEEVSSDYLDIISSEDMEKLEDLVKSTNKDKVVNILVPEDKGMRTKIHLAIKKTFSQLETKTTEVEGEKVIQVLRKSGKSQDTRPRDEWPQSKKACRYVKFVLYKENKDTMDAIGLISRNLKVKESMFQYAGTKDKRAKTSQYITAHRIHPKKLSFMNKILRNIGLGDFEYVNEPLKLGHLSGNQFTIVLRNVLGSTERVDSAMESLKSKGFINYFGMQRFGTTSVPTHKVGSALLHGDWDKAVNLILMPRDDCLAKDTFQKVWKETHDPEATLKATPRYCGLERSLLEALKKKMKPFNALEKISRNTRLLYVHSYQAFIWNRMVSKRLHSLGHKPVLGDLVLTRELGKAEHPTPSVLTEDNLEQYSLHDIVLPLPGHDVIYPSNEVHEWYREALQADGLDIDKMKRPQKDYSLPGAYRHITVLPSDVTWSHQRYDDYTLSLVASDLDVLKDEAPPVLHNKGKLKALILRMSLPSSCYATMALREILRQDTSVAHQTFLNVT